MLQAPQEPELLYEYRESADPAPDTRPLAQGDVLRAVTLRGGEVLDLAMIVAHPCSMRQGGALRRRLVVAEVAPHQKVPAKRWPTDFFDFFPLPELRESGPPVSVYFHHLHSVDTPQLESCDRVAVLTEFGQMVLLQRWIHHMARLVVEPQELNELIVPVQNELSMQMDWVEAGLDAAHDAENEYAAVGQAGPERAALLAQLGGEFQAFLGSPSDPASLRRRLSDGEHNRVYARKAVQTEIKRRYPGT
jgi:hypothetical protein